MILFSTLRSSAVNFVSPDKSNSRVFELEDIRYSFSAEEVEWFIARFAVLAG